jgi:cell division protein FtsB
VTATSTLPGPAAPAGQRPTAQKLLEHPSKAIAKQAAKVIAEDAKLTTLWKADAQNAVIRAQIAAKEAELKALREQLRTGIAKTNAVDLAVVREWARKQGLGVSNKGAISQHIIDAYHAAHQQVAS